MAKSGKKATPAVTTTTSTPAPYAPVQPGLQDLADAANAAFKAAPTPWAAPAPWQAPTPFTGSNYAAPNKDQLTSIDMLKAFGQRSAVGEDATRQLGLDTIAGKYMSPESNPYLKAAVEASINPVTQQLQRQIIPGISDAAQTSGAYGGSRQGIMEGVAAADWAKTAGGIGAQMYGDNYQQERNRQMQAPMLLDAANALGMVPINAMRNAGEMQQGFEQNGLDAARRLYEQQTNDSRSIYDKNFSDSRNIYELGLKDQWAPLANYSTILGQYSPYAQGSTTATATGGTPASGGLMAGLSGAAGGAAAGAQFGPWGAGIGGVIGGLGGLFG